MRKNFKIIIITFLYLYFVGFLQNTPLKAQQLPPPEIKNISLEDSDDLIEFQTEENSIFQAKHEYEKNDQQKTWDIIPEVAGTKTISEDQKIEEFQKKDERFLKMWQLRNRYHR